MPKPPIRLLRIDHVVLRVRDLDRSLAFYRDVLGCPLELARDELGLYQLRAGDSLIDLVTLDGPLGEAFTEPPAPPAPNVHHICVPGGTSRRSGPFLPSRASRRARPAAATARRASARRSTCATRTATP